MANIVILISVSIAGWRFTGNKLRNVRYCWDHTVGLLPQEPIADEVRAFLVIIGGVTHQATVVIAVASIHTGRLTAIHKDGGVRNGRYIAVGHLPLLEIGDLGVLGSSCKV